MQYPLIGLCAAFCSGILAATWLRTCASIFCLLAFVSLLSAIVFLKEKRSCGIFILCCAFFLGAALLKDYQLLPRDHIAKLISYKSGPVYLTGVVDSDPVRQADRVSFVLKAEGIKANSGQIKTGGRILARVFKSEKFFYGDRLFLEGRLFRPFSFSKGFNYRRYLQHQDIYLILSVKKDRKVVLLAKNAGNPLKSFAFKIKHRMREALARNLSPFSAGILNALILGDRQDLPAYLMDIFVNLGTVHIIAISGFNVGIVAFLTLLILKIIRVPRRIRRVLVILLLFVYCVLTGANTPVVRATVMAAVLLFSYFLKRLVNIYNSLSIATLIILGFNPWQLFEISFQLSFLSVVSIIWLAPKIQRIFPERLNKRALPRFLILTFCVSAAAWLGLLPIIAYYFKIISPIAILANMVIVPYSALITAAGFSLALIGILAPGLAAPFGASNELFVWVLFKLHSFFILIPGAYFKLPQVSFVFIVFYYGLLIPIFNFPALSRVITYIRTNRYRSG